MRASLKKMPGLGMSIWRSKWGPTTGKSNHWTPSRSAIGGIHRDTLTHSPPIVSTIRAVKKMGLRGRGSPGGASNREKTPNLLGVLSRGFSSQKGELCGTCGWVKNGEKKRRSLSSLT